MSLELFCSCYRNDSFATGAVPDDEPRIWFCWSTYKSERKIEFFILFIVGRAILVRTFQVCECHFFFLRPYGLCGCTVSSLYHGRGSFQGEV